MKNIFWGLIIGLGLLAALVWGLDNLTQSQADLAYQEMRGRAVVIEAQGQARLDSAQASAVMSAAMLPWAVLLCVAGVVIVCGVVVLRGNVGAPTQIIERHFYYLPAPGQVEIMFPAPRKEITHEHYISR